MNVGKKVKRIHNLPKPIKVDLKPKPIPVEIPAKKKDILIVPPK